MSLVRFPLHENIAISNSLALIEHLKSQDADRIIASGLHEFIDSLQQSLNGIGTKLQDIYFASRDFPEQEQSQQ